MAVKVSRLERVLVEETVCVVGREEEGLVGYVEKGEGLVGYVERGGAGWGCREGGGGLLGM